MIKRNRRFVSYALLGVTAIQGFFCLVVRNIFPSASYGALEWIVTLSFAPFAVFAVTAWWFPRTSSLLAAGAYAGFVAFLAQKGQDLFGSPHFLRRLDFAVVFVVPTVLLLIAALVPAFREEGFVTRRKRKYKILFLCIGFVALALLYFVLAHPFFVLVSFSERYLGAGTVEEQVEVCQELAKRFSADELYSMAGLYPRHYMRVGLNGAAEEALGLQDSPESIAALELLLREAERGVKRGTPDARQNQFRAIMGLAYAHKYNYAALFERYSTDSDALGYVGVSCMFARRRDCDRQLLDYLRMHRKKYPQSIYHSKKVADYLRSHGLKVD